MYSRWIQVLLFIEVSFHCHSEPQFPPPTFGKKVLSTNPDDVKFFLFRDPNNMSSYTEVKFGDLNSLINSGYQKSYDAVTFVVHGFMVSAFKLPYPRIVIKAYLRMKPKVNYFAVDWSKLSDPQTPGGIPGSDIPYYSVAAPNTKITGTRVGEFIEFLVKNEMLSSSSKARMVGHSLGSHVSGHTGKYVRSRGLALLKRITGLDPAGLGFQYMPNSARLSEWDAEFVDTIHTSTGIGYAGNIGHVSFYPNHGGPGQPGCIENNVDALGICAHNIVGDFFAFSIYNSSIRGCKCSNEFQDECNPAVKCNIADMETFGEYARSTARGGYYVEIGRVDPDSL